MCVVAVPAHAPSSGAAVLVYHGHLHLGITPSLLGEFLNFDIGNVINNKYKIFREDCLYFQKIRTMFFIKKKVK